MLADVSSFAFLQKKAFIVEKLSKPLDAMGDWSTKKLKTLNSQELYIPQKQSHGKHRTNYGIKEQEIWSSNSNANTKNMIDD